MRCAVLVWWYFNIIVSISAPVRSAHTQSCTGWRPMRSQRRHSKRAAPNGRGGSMRFGCRAFAANVQVSVLADWRRPPSSIGEPAWCLIILLGVQGMQPLRTAVISDAALHGFNARQHGSSSAAMGLLGIRLKDARRLHADVRAALEPWLGSRRGQRLNRLVSLLVSPSFLVGQSCCATCLAPSM